MGSTIFTINWADLGKGALVAAITAALAIIGQSIEAGQLPTSAQLKVAGLAGLTAGIGYIIKNFLTGSDGKFLTK
jgi:biotin transporter BioY